MGLARYGLAFGLGYAVGHPDRREKLRTAAGRVAELARRPEAERLREKGRSVAGHAVQTAKERLGRGSGSDNGSAATGDTRGRWTPGRRTKPAVVDEETIVVTETTGVPGSPGERATGTSTTATGTSATTTGTDLDDAMHGNLPPAKPTSGRSGPNSSAR